MNEQYVLSALKSMGALTPGQLSRFLFDTGLAAAFDLPAVLASLKEQKRVNQAVSMQGIVYEPTEAGSAADTAEADAKVAAEAEHFKALFAHEKNYLAQYTESSTGIVPVFLSIRDGINIVLKISLIVNSVDTAKKICADWIENSGAAYSALWEAIAEGEPFWKGTEYGGQKKAAASEVRKGGGA